MDLKYLGLAFDYAKKALKNDEVPIGAVIVKDNKVISFGFNNKESIKSVFGHAEINAITDAQKALNNWRLDDCDIYVTLDPCPMCASAIKQSRIRNVYSALNNSDKSNLEIIKLIFTCDSTNSAVNFISNLDVDNGKKILRDFFESKR